MLDNLFFKIKLEGMTQNEGENTQELVQTNRNLSAAMDKMEMRCKILEEKNEKLKKFKKMVKNCCGLQCSQCQRTITQGQFMSHVQNCENDQQQQQQSMISMQSSRNNSINILDLSQLQISINQTMVKETSDNKPYTEYMIKVQYGQRKWTVSRRYKHFCELHQGLINQFPGLKLPESSQAIAFTADINTILQSKRPTVIEDRRKALQQYIRDLAKIDIIRNCKSYKKFLEFEIDENSTNNNRSISQLGMEIQQLQSSREGIRDVSIGQNKKQSTQNNNLTNQSNNSQRTSVNGREQNNQQILKDSINQQQSLSQASSRIDKKLLPQSPSSFLKSWNEKQQQLNMNFNNSTVNQGKSSRLQKYSMNLDQESI